VSVAARRRPAAAAVVALLGCAALALPGTVSARYGNAAGAIDGAELVSADYARLEQGDDSTRYAAISADGRYVAIQTRARNFFADDDPDPPGGFRVGGVFRFDRQTRALVKVADGDLLPEGSETALVRGASNPSISANGRFVAFQTGQQLVPADNNGNIDVYVRDMDRDASETGAYALASARDGSAAVASYGPPAFPVSGGNPGAELSPEVAISADGRRVVFRTEVATDLPAEPGATTPPGQLLVRDLDAQTTKLVTAARGAGNDEMSADPAGGALGGAISADGSAVAWTGRNAPAQTRFLGGENTDPAFNYYLWRQAPFGAGQPTRRITGLSDPDDPVCRQQEEASPGMTTVFNSVSTGPCYGPLTDQESNRADIGSLLPALSGDGLTVAFLTGAGPRPVNSTGAGYDLYVTGMAPGLSRKQATVELTRDSQSGDTATSASLNSLSMSPDGRYLALTTARTQFTLPALRLVGTPRSIPGPRELYVVDRAAGTIERVARAIGGGDVDGSAQEGVTLSDGAEEIAFSSFAGNLFFGDANQRTDAFVATRLPEAPIESAPGVGEAGSSESFEFRAGPHLGVHAKAKAGGIVILTINVPAAGEIEAIARGRAGNPAKLRTIAVRETHARGRGALKVVMAADPRFRPALDRGAKLQARIRVNFKPSAGGKRLHASTTATFSG
jgi:hypothetical protein